MFKDCPLHTLQRGNGRAENAFDRSPGSSVVELFMLRYFDALGHGGGIQVSHDACVSATTGASESYTGSKSLPAAMSTIVTLFPMQPLRQARRHLEAELLQLRFVGFRDRDYTVIGLRQRCASDHCQTLPQRDRRPAMDLPNPLDAQFRLLQLRSSHRRGSSLFQREIDSEVTLRH